MSRVALILWNAEEAKERARILRQAGHRVVCFSEQGGEGLKAFREKPPDAFVIDLCRLPSHGRAVATWLRQQKPTRHVPIVFIEGDPEKTRRMRKLIPDAEYTTWRRIRGSLRRAIQRPPKDPVVPGTMADYSGTPLPKKLGIKPGSVVALLGAPAGFRKTLGDLPDKVRLRTQARGRSDVMLLFAKSRAVLERRFPAAARNLAEGGRLWLLWPKKTSDVASDLNQNEVRAFGLGQSFVDFKISAIDETWSGLCFARRRPGR
jgi:CheY-like chemotaxis protein